MSADADLTLDAKARRRLWQVYKLILDCAASAEEETADDGNPCPGPSSAASMLAQTSETQNKG